MNASHEEAVEFAKQSKRENRVYVGNLSYDVKYRDLIEFMRGGGLGDLRLVFYVQSSEARGAMLLVAQERAVVSFDKLAVEIVSEFHPGLLS